MPALPQRSTAHFAAELDAAACLNAFQTELSTAPVAACDEPLQRCKGPTTSRPSG